MTTIPTTTDAASEGPVRGAAHAPVAAASSRDAEGPFIRCRGVTRTYVKGSGRARSTVTPLEALDLDVPRGDFIALMGPSGSGKTTLLNLLAAIDRPTAGSVVVDGTDLASLPGPRLAAWRALHVGYVFQLYNLVPVLTAYENVELPLLLRRLSRRERHARVVHALEVAGIAHRHDHLPRQLSGGQEQRVAIARAIVGEPSIIVADEPTGDLDRDSAEAILALLRRLNEEERRTIVMVTHDPSAAASAKRTLHLDKGRLVHERADGAFGDADRAAEVTA